MLQIVFGCGKGDGLFQGFRGGFFDLGEGAEETCASYRQ